MKKGLSLVELLVVVAITLLLSGGALVYINDFNAKQKMELTRKELVSNLRLARSYALTNQMPEAGSLEYVEVSVAEDGVIEALVNGVGTSYFSHDVSPTGVSVSLGVAVLRFSAYDGKRVEDSGPVGVDDLAQIIISSAEVGSTLVIEVESSGLINEK